MEIKKRSFGFNVWSDDVSHQIRLNEGAVRILKKENVRIKDFDLYEIEGVLEIKENTCEITLVFEKQSDKLQTVRKNFEE